MNGAFKLCRIKQQSHPRGTEVLSDGTVLLWLGVVFAEFGLGIIIAQHLLKADFDWIDHAILRSFGAVRLSWLGAAAADTTALGSFSAATIVAISAAILFWSQHHRMAALQMLATLGGATILVHLMKSIIQRPRPAEISPPFMLQDFPIQAGTP